MSLKEIVIWQFPPDDVAAWRKLTGELLEYRGYTNMLAAAQADHERQGRVVRRVHFTVAEMRQQLELAGLENRPDHRAMVIGCWPDVPPRVRA